MTMGGGLIVRRALRETLRQEGSPRATLSLRGVDGVSATAMLEAAERVRGAMALLGILDLSIEVVPEPEQESNGNPPAA